LGVGLLQLLFVVVLGNRSQHRSLGYPVALVDVAHLSRGIADLPDTGQISIRLKRQLYLLIGLYVGRVGVRGAGIDGLHFTDTHWRQGRSSNGILAAAGQEPRADE